MSEAWKWKPPTVMCDTCRAKPATRWFMDTSVAVCDQADCYQRQTDRWDQMLEDQAEDHRWQ